MQSKTNIIDLEPISSSQTKRLKLEDYSELTIEEANDRTASVRKMHKNVPNQLIPRL
jgi:hypothetical protein